MAEKHTHKADFSQHKQWAAMLDALSRATNPIEADADGGSERRLVVSRAEFHGLFVAGDLTTTADDKITSSIEITYEEIP